MHCVIPFHGSFTSLQFKTVSRNGAFTGLQIFKQKSWHRFIEDCCCFLLLSMRRELAIVLKPRPIPMPAKIGYSLRGGRRGSLDCVWGVQTHSGPPVFLVPFRKDLARMNGTPQPNQKWLPAQGLEPGSLDHESQPLTIRPLLTPNWGLCSHVHWAENTTEIHLNTSNYTWR